MENENGSWIMRGLDWGHPYRTRTWQDFEAKITPVRLKKNYFY